VFVVKKQQRMQKSVTYWRSGFFVFVCFAVVEVGLGLTKYLVLMFVFTLY
jgi:hypothetical protein